MAMAGRNAGPPVARGAGRLSDFPAIRGDEVAIGFGWSVNQAFQPESPQGVDHLVGRVIGQRHAQQIRYLLPEIRS